MPRHNHPHLPTQGELFPVAEPSAPPTPSQNQTSTSTKPSSSPPASPPPLAARMRPRSLDEFLGQSHLLSPGKPLHAILHSGSFSSLILYGPPGSGKTSLAHLIAQSTHSHFVQLSGVEHNAPEIRRTLQQAIHRKKATGKETILFLDEIHRFNKPQQDVLLPDVEAGNVRLIGATTHNPFFYLTSPLLSRSILLTLEPLSTDDLLTLLHRALAEPHRGIGHIPLRAEPDALLHIAQSADGDARKCLAALELAAAAATTAHPPTPDSPAPLTLEIAAHALQKKALLYADGGDAHYDTISAFIKSMRGSDPDATLYWLAKLLEAGEDPRFLARRIVICASEDVGLADSRALLVATAAAHAVELCGMPEARIPLAHAALYVATAPKSNRAYAALEAALHDIRTQPTLTVPPHLRDAHYPGAAQLGHGKDYLYPHDFPEGYVPQSYLPKPRSYYHPSPHGEEALIAQRLLALRPKNQPPPPQNS